MADEKKIERLVHVSRVFTPGTAVRSLSSFSGRWDLISEVFSVLARPGQHVALFGDRGVGKTSLANVLGESFSKNTDTSYLRSVRHGCSSGDTFQTLWRTLFRRLGHEQDELWIASPATILDVISGFHGKALIVIDELDRFDDQDGLSLLADTIKTLSDEDAKATLVLVGVSESIGQLIGDHKSIGRALVQVKVPRMSRSDLMQIVTRGLADLGMSASEGQVARIATLSEGLPHYTHLLAFHAAERAVQDDRLETTASDVDAALGRAVDKAQDDIQKAYSNAVFSPRADNLFKEVLLACALAEKDEVGFFTAGAVRQPLASILHRNVDIPAFARHLNEFTKHEHGSVLEKRGGSHRQKYRFTDPMLQPYIILKGIASKLLSESEVQRFRAEERTPAIPDGM